MSTKKDIDRGEFQMKAPLFVCTIAFVASTAMAHDLFLVVPDHDLPEDSAATVSLINGTFDTSENSIDRDRMIDVSVVDGAGLIVHPTEDQWRDQDDATLLDFKTGSAGTYVVGVSTKARGIDLSAEDFNEYLKHDGVLDVLEARRKQGALNRGAHERYSKHVKTILQVGKLATDTYRLRLGYPLEIVPLANPATLKQGDHLEILVLAGGKPVSGQLVYASYAGFHSDDEDGGHHEAVSARTDDSGLATIAISQPGRWYVRLIRMIESAEDGVDYESNWATLTFEVR
jgi:uncharacterized GH25 family protein